MKKILSFVAIVALLVPMTTSAYTVQPGDTPYQLWGSEWQEELSYQVGTSDPTKLPVGIEVDLEQQLGAKPIITQTSYWDDDGTTLTPKKDREVEIGSATFTTGTIDTLSTSDVKVTATTTYTETLTDGTFANWNTYNVPDEWEYSDFDDNANFDLMLRSTDKHAGVYAMQTEAGTSWSGVYMSDILFSATDTVFVADDTVQITAYAKTVSGAGQYCAMYSYIDDSDDDVYYNFTADTWDVGFGAGSTNCLTPTSEYTLLEFEEATAPSSGVNEGVAFFAYFATTDGPTALVDDVQLLYNGVNGADNTGFEDWSLMANPDDPLVSWDYTPQADGDEGISISTDAVTGDYSVKITADEGSVATDTLSYILQEYEGVSTTEMTANIYSKCESNTYDDDGTKYLSPGVMFTNATSSYTEVWNVSSNSWIATTTPLIDLFGTGVDFSMGDYGLGLSTTTDWVQGTATTTIPTNGTVVMNIMGGFGGDNGASYFFDDAELIEAVDVGSNTINVLKGYNESALTDLETKDSIINILMNTSTDAFRLDGTGVFHTDLASLSFELELLKFKCIAVLDTDGGGYTYLTTLDGDLTSTTTPCTP